MLIATQSLSYRAPTATSIIYICTAKVLCPYVAHYAQSAGLSRLVLSTATTVWATQSFCCPSSGRRAERDTWSACVYTSTFHPRLYSWHIGASFSPTRASCPATSPSLLSWSTSHVCQTIQDPRCPTSTKCQQPCQVYHVLDSIQHVETSLPPLEQIWRQALKSDSPSSSTRSCTSSITMVLGGES